MNFSTNQVEAWPVFALETGAARNATTSRKLLVRQIMRIGVLAISILSATLQVVSATPGSGQNAEKTRISNLDIKDRSLKSALRKLEKSSNFRFVYRDEEIKKIDNRTISNDVFTVAEVLNQLLLGTPFTYREINRNILIVRRSVDSLGNVNAIEKISGKVVDKDGTPLAGVTVTVKGTALGTTTDMDGKFSVDIPESSATLVFSFIGFATQEFKLPSTGEIVIILEESASTLEEIVVTVGRGAQRTFTDTPLPVDNFTNKDLTTTGQFTFDKALQYRVPSFNTVNTPVNDASTLLDPYEIRNLGPSRLLVLINGKRKNLSSLLYVQFAPGRGETGVDLSAIPTAAVKRVEILRDGASAQYGSDAIAGVMNVILKDKYQYSELNVNSGITSKGDGGSYGMSFNSGSNFGKNGFINYTIGVKQQDNAVRSGKIDVTTEIATFGNPGSDNTDPTNANIISFLKLHPTGGNINGTGATSAAQFEYNLGIPVGEHGQFYSNGAYVFKKVMSNANYRVPYWKVDYGLLHTPDPNGVNYTGDNTVNSAGVEIYKGYNGYMPTFEGDLKDYNATFGYKNEINGWVTDVSITTGGNQQLYTVNNTVNHSLGAKSPTSFKPGGFKFNHIVGNFDANKAVRHNINIALGSEVRSETYQIIAGDTASYSGQGSNSFPGIRAENARTNSRYNLGAYLDATWDITKNFLIAGTVRSEKYSDFGNANVGKFSTRLKLADEKIVLRGSVSSGFRAPTLHQIYAQSTQASSANGTIVLSGLFNNGSKEAYALGVPKLKAEKSTNITVGTGLNLNSNLSITVDYYNIKISDRIVYSSSITTDDRLLATPTTELGRILKGSATGAGNADLASVQFFINGIKTRTQGLDVVASYKNVEVGNGTLGFNLAGNFTLSNEIIGTPKDPKAIKDAGSTILNAQVKSLLTEGRPKYKGILGIDYSIHKFNFVVNNTLFGPTKFQDIDNGGSVMENIKQVFDPAVVTDVNIGYAFTKNISASFSINNIFNVLPKWKLELTGKPTDANYAAAKSTLSSEADTKLLEGFLEFSGRYRILGYNGSQFSQLGTMFMGQLTFKF
ncbi:MAG TPA: TonB-dependent receptor [Cyclobacteriaceae bacterium]